MKSDWPPDNGRRRGAGGSGVVVFAVVCLVVLSGPARAAERPVVFWGSDPIRAGETALLYGDGLQQTNEIRVFRLSDEPDGAPFSRSEAPRPLSAAAGIQARPLQPSDTSVKLVIPKELQPGVLAVWVHTPQGWSEPFILNRPQVWWVQGDRGLEGTPGGWLRILGTNLISGPSLRTRLRVVRSGSDSPSTPLVVDESDMYSVKASVPSTLAEGRYDVLVHNGRGGASSWARSASIHLRRSTGWPTTVLDVTDFGAKGDGTTDDTAAFVTALTRAREAGGGVIHLPRGIYKVTSTLRIPPQTVLRGERRDLVHVFWPDAEPARPAVIEGGHSFAIEDVTLQFSLVRNGIVADEPGSRDIRLRRVRARWLLYSGHLKPEIVDTRLREALRLSSGGGDLVRVSGQNVEITDCDLYSSGRALVLKQVEGAFVARNTIYNGRWGWYNFNGGERIIFEHNNLSGADLMSTGGSISTYGVPSSQHIYFAHNTFTNLFGWDREAMTTDAGGGDHVGLIASATPTTVTYPEAREWKPGALAGKVAYVLSGRGKGQFRRIASHTDRSFTVGSPWIVVPDATSVVGITWMRGNYLFVGNTATDSGMAIQLYGVAFNTVVAGNRSVRAGGFRSHAARYLGDYNVPLSQGVQPQMFVQYLDNEIAEGGSYHMGANTGSVLGLQALAPGPSWKWPLAFAFVFRGNRLDSHARIRTGTKDDGAPLIEDVIIENNTVQNATVGVEVGMRADRVLARGNRFERVQRPTIDERSRMEVLADE